MDEWLINPNEKTVHRIPGFRRNLAANEEHHEDRNQRDTKEGGEEHGERFGEGEGLKEAAFLRGKRKHRNEAYGYDEQGEEKRAPYAFSSGDDYFDALGVGRV